MALNSKIYVDKTGLIDYTNSLIGTEQRYLCVSRPRRFGKSMAANMLAAYYGSGEDTSALFDGLIIGGRAGYRENLNGYNVVQINMQMLLSANGTVDGMLDMLKKYLLFDFKRSFPELLFIDEGNLVSLMNDVCMQTGRQFIIIIDEWDCLFREFKDDLGSQRKYLDFLRMWLKDQSYVALAYMTGILPIKKYGTHSALNMFSEYSMTDSGDIAEYFGFTVDEVAGLCSTYGMDFQEVKDWYDGYRLPVYTDRGDGNISIYNPKSLVEAIRMRRIENYWNRTESYEALKVYIQMDMDGLKDAVVSMLAGGEIPVNTGSFTNDMTTFATKDDVLTLLVHLGYLSYDWFEKTVSIPNKEVSQEYVTAIGTMDWSEVTRSVMASKKLLEALWSLDADAVAEGIDMAHNEISVLEYNDENSLSCTINLAFYFAREYYSIYREFPSGKGFADICFVPRRCHADKPAAVIELKWDRSAEGAIAQIKEKNYTESLKDYKGSLLLCGINYDKKDKTHTCVIEQAEK